MGIAWLLLKRTFGSRPRRTLLFLFGYGLATAVMITLLAVGEAVLLQAQDKDLLGGGDLILVPQGIDIESLKVGGLQAMYYTIPQARFLVRQVLGSSRYKDEIKTVCPYLFSRLLYARKTENESVSPLYAEGSLPDQEQAIRGTALPWNNLTEDTEWLAPDPEHFYHEIDRFHVPQSEHMDLSRWAEWHYFNFDAADFRGYLSIMAAGDVLHDRGKWIVSLQLLDTEEHRYVATDPARMDQLPLKRIEYHTGAARVQFVKDHYEISLDYTDRIPVRGTIRYFPDRRLYFPPAVLARSEKFESGYVIPAIRGTYEGSLTAGGSHYDFTGAAGYHDHNWGIWQHPQAGSSKDGAMVTWNWGHAFSSDYALFYGEIFLQGASKGLFFGVFDNQGFLTMFRPDRIEYSGKEPAGKGLVVPSTLRIRQEKPFTGIDLFGRKQSLAVTPVGSGDAYFLQYGMDFDIELTVDGRTTAFSARGNAETFVPK